MTEEHRVGVNPKIAYVLPRKSGEIVFNADWERQAFGLAVALCEKGDITFDQFRWALARELAEWQRAHGPAGTPYRFYEMWLAALEKVLVGEGLLSEEELRQRLEKALPEGQGAK